MRICRLLGLTVFLVLLAATQTFGASLVYLDGLVGGFVNSDTTPTATGTALGVADEEDDLNLTFISGGGLIGKIKYGLEYGQGTIESVTASEDLSMINGLVGYRIVDKLAFKLDLAVASFMVDGEYQKLSAIFYGFEPTLFLSKKLFLTASFLMGNGTYERDGFKADDETPVQFMRAKLHYLLTEHLGITASYCRLNYEFGMDHQLAGDLGDCKINLGGPIVGMFYTF